MEDIQEDELNLNAGLIATDLILSDEQVDFGFSDILGPDNEVFDLLNQFGQNDELEMILDNFQEFDDFQLESYLDSPSNVTPSSEDSPSNLTPSSEVESSPQTSELDFNNGAVLEDFAILPDGYKTPDISLESADSKEVLRDPQEEMELTVIPKLSIVLQQDPKCLTQRQKLIDSWISNRKNFVAPKGRPPRGRSILKPLTMRKEVYSKIPSYYTAIAPVDKIKETAEEASTSCKENIYDKLPPYLTEFVNDKNKNSQSCQATIRTKVKTEASNLASQSNQSKLEIKQSSNFKSDAERKLVDERRVLHVGNIKRGTTREQLYVRFKMFGQIEDIKLHYRDEGDCYAFITYKYTIDAFDALEHGNDDEPRFELSLGGRRLFCLQRYSDLDSLETVSRSSQKNSEFRHSSQSDTNSPCSSILSSSSQPGKHKIGQINKQSHDFDSLLKAARSNIRIAN